MDGVLLQLAAYPVQEQARTRSISSSRSSTGASRAASEGGGACADVRVVLLRLLSATGYFQGL
jgi:hypothetical protein